ncbi:hypothetical protein [Candidatus Nitrospira neomarina]|uniref:Uncharacterized protein n=1 Tax=Candidatus Nitrospira neomarina TaxID=3020899 RepID=A0AA96K532_9BACT|nr:hypothetical protein [Candidatus Nitrospira neomarina]WNM64004.1 hypothetical protein PQG83_09685 [Candidatus Nitrospira neomarina]
MGTLEGDGGMPRACESDALIAGGASVVVGDRESLLQGEGEQLSRIVKQTI